MPREKSYSLSYPALYDAADKTSLAAQQWYLRFSAIRLAALVGTAGVMLLTSLIESWAPITAVLFLAAALAGELLILTLHPERQWYEGRAIAESVKTLSWKYQVGGEPFGVDGPNAADVDTEFIRRLDQLVTEFRDLNLRPAEKNQITEAMRQIRMKSLDERRDVYRASRIDDQQTWYARNSDWNRTWALRWQIGLVLIEIAGILAAIFRALNLVQSDAYGFLAAVAAAGVGWLQIKQHQNLAKAYSVASHELASILSRMDAAQDEDEWKRFVDHAEVAISREHTLWLASRSG